MEYWILRLLGLIRGLIGGLGFRILGGRVMVHRHRGWSRLMVVRSWAVF